MYYYDLSVYFNYIEPTDLEPPYDVHVSDINPNEFSIDWSQSPSSSCDRQTLTYNIAATSDCGECPNTTFDTSIRCTNQTVTIDGQACLVVIQTQADAKNKSEHSVAINVTVLLRGKITVTVLELYTCYCNFDNGYIQCLSSKCSRDNSQMDKPVYFNPY